MWQKKKKNQTQSFPFLLKWTLPHSIGSKDTGRWTLVRSQPEKVSNSRTLYLLILLHSWILSMSSSCRFLISVPVGFFFSFFPVSMVKSPPARTGDSSSVRGLGRSPGEGSGNPFQYSCLPPSHGWRSLAGYSPWVWKQVGHDLAAKQQAK